MSKTTARTVRMSKEQSEAIDEIAKICNRDANFIMREAIKEYVDHNQRIIDETERRIALLESGKAKLIPHEKVKNRIMERLDR